MRQDATALTPKSRSRLRHYGSDLNAMIVNAIEEAKDRGEFVSSMPVLDVGLHLVSIANSGGPITQDARSFDRLDHLYNSFVRIITLAFGPDERASPGHDGAKRGEPASQIAASSRSQALD
jgi:hypothetical protein